MANVSEAKKETVRIAVPPPPVTNPVPPSDPGHDTEVVAAATSDLKPRNLPGLGESAKPPLRPGPTAINPIASPTQSPQVTSFKPPAPPGLQKAIDTATPSSFPGAQPTSRPASFAPKKETARIELAPEPKSVAPRVKMSKTQPLMIAPTPSAKSSPVLTAPENAGAGLYSISLPLCWALLAVSAITLIIQLWIYFS